MDQLNKSSWIGAVVIGFVLSSFVHEYLMPDRNYQKVGRYQIQSSVNGLPYIFDTTTGRCYVQVGTGQNSDDWKEIYPNLPIEPRDLPSHNPIAKN